MQLYGTFFLASAAKGLRTAGVKIQQQNCHSPLWEKSILRIFLSH